MAIIDGLIMEMTHEGAATRKTLERLPEHKLDWTPHPKSFTARKLASHLAEIPGYVIPTLQQTEFVIVPGQYTPFVGASRAEILAKHDQSLAAALAAMQGIPDEDLMVTWTFKLGDQTVFAMPRVGVIRVMVISHLIHHRAQLGVYLRILDVPVPAIYGPSADEQR